MRLLKYHTTILKNLILLLTTEVAKILILNTDILGHPIIHCAVHYKLRAVLKLRLILEGFTYLLTYSLILLTVI